MVKLSDGEYEVHNIGVNWPHHIFVNQNFNVVGADYTMKLRTAGLRPVSFQRSIGLARRGAA